MDICYPFYAIYKIYLYALSYISFIISSFLQKVQEKYGWMRVKIQHI